MTERKATDRTHLERFVQLSAALTGYDEVTLWGTGMADEYLKTLMLQAGSNGNVLLTYADDVERIFDESHLEPLAVLGRAVIKLWYLGMWIKGPAPSGVPVFVTSPEAYKEALAWTAMGGHVQGGKQQGYGSWSLPPVGAEEEQ
jgi:hypothetical protein